MIRQRWEAARPHFDDALEKLGELVGTYVLWVALLLGGVIVFQLVAPGVRSFMACPIHVTRTDTAGYPINDYCLHLGTGR